VTENNVTENSVTEVTVTENGVTAVYDALHRAYAGARQVLVAGTGERKVASYIPALATADPMRLGVTVMLADGNSYSAGDTDTPFTLQSVSKIVSLSLALQLFGMEKVFSRVGMEPTGDPYNSLVKLEAAQQDKPLNPFINAGAIAICSLLAEELGAKAAEEQIYTLTAQLCAPEPVGINETVYLSEAATSHRNRALAYLLKELGAIRGEPEVAVHVYLRQCALEVTCRGLAAIALCYAHPHLANQAVGLPLAVLRLVNTFMVTCGMYNASGEFAIKAGIPAKSGVSGAVMATVPGRMGIGVIGPALDDKGNSIGGTRFLIEFSRLLNLSMF